MTVGCQFYKMSLFVVALQIPLTWPESQTQTHCSMNMYQWPPQAPFKYNKWSLSFVEQSLHEGQYSRMTWAHYSWDCFPHVSIQSLDTRCYIHECSTCTSLLWGTKLPGSRNLVEGTESFCSFGTTDLFRQKVRPATETVVLLTTSVSRHRYMIRSPCWLFLSDRALLPGRPLGKIFTFPMY